MAIVSYVTPVEPLRLAVPLAFKPIEDKKLTGVIKNAICEIRKRATINNEPHIFDMILKAKAEYSGQELLKKN